MGNDGRMKQPEEEEEEVKKGGNNGDCDRFEFAPIWQFGAGFVDPEILPSQVTRLARIPVCRNGLRQVPKTIRK